MRGRIIIVPLLAIGILTVMSCKKKKVDVGINDSAIELIDSLHDFGTYHGDSIIQRCSFRLRNAGTEPLVIYRIETSCGCTTSQFSREPIAPGDVTVIKVAYNGRGLTPGVFIKTLDIYSNSGSGLARLTIRGNMEK